MFGLSPALPQAAGFVLAATVLLSGCMGGVFYDHGQNGEWGPEFLSASKYTRLIVEIDYEPGAQPESATLSRLETTLNRYLDKPGGIDIRQSGDIDGNGPGTKYKFGTIRDSLEDDARDHYKGGDEAVLYVMFLNGGSEADSSDGSVLGAAYSGSSVVMFKENIRKAKDNCFSVAGLGCPSVATIEDAVMTHELGHVLGLVNNGIPMQTPHEDKDHEGHSDSSRSVMFWKVDTGNIIDFIQNGNKIPNEFDDNDRADMKAAGGK